MCFLSLNNNFTTRMYLIFVYDVHGAYIGKESRAQILAGHPSLFG